MTQYIKAPFNFVPLNEKVYTPSWADQVSHDIPFSDGESGEIELTLTAKTPVFVRNGHTREDADKKDEKFTSFSKDANGNYFIPATSVKGMIRNVLEIISFGKMSRVSNDRFGYRDLHNKEYMNVFQNIEQYVHCGYMRKSDFSEVTIADHGRPFRISHTELDRHFGSSLVKYCSDSIKLKEESNRTAAKKYAFFAGKEMHVTCTEDDSQRSFDKDTRRFVRIDSRGGITGHIILTGQPSARNRRYDPKKGKEAWSGKFYEFFFRSDFIAEKRVPIGNKEDVRFQDFLFIYGESLDWKSYWRDKFEAGESIPIFFIQDKEGKILHFGLSYLYKLPYNLRVKECLPSVHNSSDPDLADLIFGNHDLGLKGRVQFSHAKLSQGSLSTPVVPLMGSPKASYYPIYLQQPGDNGILSGNQYSTYSGKSPLLKGWKRYPVHNSPAPMPVVDKKQEKNVSPFVPLGAGSTFSVTIRFHNLRPEEIGALLLSITLNDSNGSHSIGFAKPYGYGKVKLSINAHSLQNKDDVYCDAFKKSISQAIHGWGDSLQLKELLLMTQEQDDNKLDYMPLSDFADAKSIKKSNARLFLPYYSDYIKDTSYRVPSERAAPHERRASATYFPKPSIPVPQNKEEIPPLIVESGWIKAEVCGSKAVSINGFDYPIALVIPREKQNISVTLHDVVWVKEKQKSKDGRLIQVEFMGRCLPN